MNRKYIIKNKLSTYWICQLGGWSLVAIIAIFLLGITTTSFNNFFQGSLTIIIDTSIGIATTHLLRKNFLKANIFQYDIKDVAIQIVKFCFLYALIFAAGCTFVFFLLNNQEIYNHNLKAAILLLFICSMLIFPWALLYYGIHFIAKAKNTELQKVKLENVVKDLELKNLKAHINPHFIFNALNTIRALIEIDPTRSRKAITELSNILRSSLKADSTLMTEFEIELNIIQDYLALEKLRFDDRLTVEYDIKPETLHLQIPPMMIQTLVENGLKHGISKRIEGGLIRIESFVANKNHIIRVINSGNFDPDVQKDAQHTGFGLRGTRARLQHLYKGHASLELKQKNNEDQSFIEAEVAIPMNKLYRDKKVFWDLILDKYN